MTDFSLPPGMAPRGRPTVNGMRMNMTRQCPNPRCQKPMRNAEIRVHARDPITHKPVDLTVHHWCDECQIEETTEITTPSVAESFADEMVKVIEDPR